MSRLYYTDSYLTRFSARILERSPDGLRVILDQTAFYPPSGGQPADAGWINDVTVEKIEEDDGRIAHIMAAPLEADQVEGRIDWARRFDNMQQHSGQHLLSAVLAELFGLETVSVHMGASVSTVDLKTAALTSPQIEAAEERANQIVTENRRVRVSFEDAAQAEGLRKASTRDGELRIVTIEELDRSACGGTHVRSTGEIGPILLRGTEKIRGDVRLEFLCGGRAIRQSRSDYRALTRVAQRFSARIEDAPLLVESALSRLQEADKLGRKLQGELSRMQGEQMFANLTPNAAGLRIYRSQVTGPIPEEYRLQAQGFVSRPGAVYVVEARDPGALLIASSAPSVNAGTVLKSAVAAAGGRGGGSPQMAQGSLPEGGAEAAMKVVDQALSGD